MNPLDRTERVSRAPVDPLDIVHSLDLLPHFSSLSGRTAHQDLVMSSTPSLVSLDLAHFVLACSSSISAAQEHLPQPDSSLHHNSTPSFISSLGNLPSFTGSSSLCPLSSPLVQASFIQSKNTWIFGALAAAWTCVFTDVDGPP